MIAREEITGLILAGGRGSRMEGEDKGLLLFDGEPLALRAAKAMRPHVSRLLLSANRHLDRYRAFGMPVVTDSDYLFRGPLAGIVRALEVTGTAYLAVAPCDMPFLPGDLIPRLARRLEEARAPVCVARAGAQSQPLCALIRCETARDLRAYLERGEAKVQAWMHQQRAAVEVFTDAGAFLNVNTARELADAQGLSPRRAEA